MKPCPKCNQDHGIFEKIGRFLFYRCLACGYSITAKHYRAKLQESQTTPEKNYLKAAMCKAHYSIISQRHDLSVFDMELLAYTRNKINEL